MLRTSILGAAAAAALALASAAPAEMLYDIEIDLRHSVAWEYQDESHPDACKEWSKGSGSQELEVRTKKPQRVELEILFGKPAITAWGGSRGTGRYSAIVDRTGTWKTNWVPMTDRCWPCGPLSEFGECDPDPTPPPTPSFRCGPVKPPAAYASVGYRTQSGTPDIREGLAVRAWVGERDLYESCPPTIGGRRVAALQHEWPSKEWAKLPVDETNRIMRLRRGGSITVEVTQSRMYARQDGTVTRGERCSAMPSITAGHGECARSVYKVRFTRVR